MVAPIVGGSVRHEYGTWAGAVRFAGENGMSDTDYELATATRHVAEARRIVARQRARVVRLKAQGRATLDHELTLRALLSTLAILESGARELAGSAKRLERPQRKLS